MKRLGTFLLSLICLAALLAMPALAEEAPALPYENPFLSMEILDMHGEPFDVEQLRGKPLLLNFWASWCPPCIAEMPDLSELSAVYQDQLWIIGILADGVLSGVDGEIAFHQKELSDARAYYEEAGILYPSLIPNELMLGIQAQLQLTGIPSTLLIDENGYLRSQPIVGSRSREGWVQIIDAFLEEIQTDVSPAV